jgi:hypothetical protein
VFADQVEETAAGTQEAASGGAKRGWQMRATKRGLLKYNNNAPNLPEFSKNLYFPLAGAVKALCDSPKIKPRPLGRDYLFSVSARRAIFFAKYNASTRDTDSCTNHITLDDLKSGLQREQRGKSKVNAKKKQKELREIERRKNGNGKLKGQSTQ